MRETSRSYVSQYAPLANQCSLYVLLYRTVCQAHKIIMCNLYRMTATIDEMRKLFGEFDGSRTNLNTLNAIFPNQSAPVLKQNDYGLTLSNMTWGVPGWKQGMRPITNVRNLESSFWKSMLSKPENRCLVPVTSFCEWKGEKGNKEKVWFEVTDQPLFAFAGIWRMGDDGPRYAFLTCEPNILVGTVHPKAMPVILPANAHHDWLQGNYVKAVSLAKPYSDSEMTITDQ